MLRERHQAGDRCLIFTQMSKMLNILEAFLNIYGYRYLRLDGTTKTDERARMMEQFNTDKSIFVFILSTRTGGVGMNLTGANVVIFYDIDWCASRSRCMFYLKARNHMDAGSSCRRSESRVSACVGKASMALHFRRRLQMVYILWRGMVTEAITLYPSRPDTAPLTTRHTTPHRDEMLRGLRILGFLVLKF